MKYNTLYIVPKGTFGDKNDNLQFRGNVDMANEIKAIVCGIGQWGEYADRRIGRCNHMAYCGWQK